MQQDDATHDGPPDSLDSITRTASDAGLSRRHLMSAFAAGAGAIAFAGHAGATAEDGNSGSGDDDPSNVDVLNYALTLEHLENEFYRQGRKDFSESELRTAETLCARDEGTNENVPARIEAIGAHEQAHVDTLTQVIEDLGGDPVEAGCYEFGYESPSDFLNVARVLENTGVSAYTGAIHFLDADKLATAGATIATVEARHASYLNSITGTNPFPRAFDQAKTREEITEAASQFIVECEE